MSNRIRAEIQLDHHHAYAVCQGIGERLRDALDKTSEAAPQKLHDLFARLPELDHEQSPPIVPASYEAF